MKSLTKKLYLASKPKLTFNYKKILHLDPPVTFQNPTEIMMGMLSLLQPPWWSKPWQR